MGLFDYGFSYVGAKKLISNSFKSGMKSLLDS